MLINKTTATEMIANSYISQMTSVTANFSDKAKLQWILPQFCCKNHRSQGYTNV